MTSNNTEVVARGYGVVDLSNLSSGSSTRSTGTRGGGIDSKHSGGSANAKTNVGAVLPLNTAALERCAVEQAAPTEVLLGVGGRVDVKRQIEEFNVVASFTDTTLRDYDAAPWLKEALVTADKKISSASLPLQDELWLTPSIIWHCARKLFNNIGSFSFRDQRVEKSSGNAARLSGIE